MNELESRGVEIGHLRSTLTRDVAFADGLYRDAVANTARNVAASQKLKQADLILDIART